MSHRLWPAHTVRRADYTAESSFCDSIGNEVYPLDVKSGDVHPHGKIDADIPVPLKSTLPSKTLRHGPSKQGAARGLPMKHLLFKNEGDLTPEELTFSTDRATPRADARRRMPPARDDNRFEFESPIPGVGRGVYRPSNGYFGAYDSPDVQPDRLHDLSSDKYLHPSPGTAARHNLLRTDPPRSSPFSKASAARPILSHTRRSNEAAPSVSSGASEDGGESQTSSHSTISPFKVTRRGPTAMSSFVSTGNHQAFEATPQFDSFFGTNEEDMSEKRPALDFWTLHELDQANDQQDANAKKVSSSASKPTHSSPSPEPKSSLTRRLKQLPTPLEGKFDGTPRTVGKVEERHNRGLAGGNVGTRKVSDQSSKTNSSGRTLVDGVPSSDRASRHSRERHRQTMSDRDADNASPTPAMKLPSGLKMGPAANSSETVLPELTGMTSAIGTPKRAFLGVHHRSINKDIMSDEYMVEPEPLQVQQIDEMDTHIKRLEKIVFTKFEDLQEGQQLVIDHMQTIKGQWAALQNEMGLSKEHRPSQRRHDEAPNGKHSRNANPGHGCQNGECTKQLYDVAAQIAKLGAELDHYRAEEARRKDQEQLAQKWNQQRAQEAARQQRQAFSSPPKPSMKAQWTYSQATSTRSLDREFRALRDRLSTLADEMKHVCAIVDYPDDHVNVEQDDKRVRHKLASTGSDQAQWASHRHTEIHGRSNGERHSLDEHRRTSGDRVSDDGHPATKRQAAFDSIKSDGLRSGKTGSEGGRSSPFVSQRLRQQASSEDQDWPEQARRQEVRNRRTPSPAVVGGSHYVNEDEEADETARPPLSRPPSVGQDRSDQDIASQAHSRAERATESLRASCAGKSLESKDEYEQQQPQQGICVNGEALYHDANRCTVCTDKKTKEKKREARRHRARGHGSARAQLEAESKAAEEERLQQSFLEAAAAAASEAGEYAADFSLNRRQLKVLQRLIDEHVDEFIHHRMLYCELADELKLIDPSMSRTKRRILAEHVLEAVETLEWKAERINALQSLLPESATTLANSPPTSDAPYCQHHHHRR